MDSCFQKSEDHCF